MGYAMQQTFLKEFVIDNKRIIVGDAKALKANMQYSMYCMTCKDMINPYMFYIVVDKHFYKLSASAKKFIIWHEIGHIMNNDLETDTSKVLRSNILRTFGISNKMEFNADWYATIRAGLNKKQAVKCLLELKLKSPLTSGLELLQRAIAIMIK